jgi:hypothetical protein
MKSKIFLSLALLISAMGAFAQKDNVGIGTTKPDQSAALEISSNNKGLLTPRMSLQQRNAIQNPAQGLIVYQTDLLSGFYFYDGKEWKSMTSETGAKSVADANNWGLMGNSVTGSEYIGTNSNHPLIMKSAGQRVAFLDQTGYFNFFIGNASGVNSTPTGTAGALNSGSYNTALGGVALNQVTTGVGNNAFGYAAAPALKTGSYNTAIGTSALQSNVSGNNNVAIGSGALYLNTASDNMALGSFALNTNTSGINNVAIGSGAGSGSTGSGSIFIGYQAGSSEIGGNKLYLSNSNTATPLIYGDFSTKYLAVGEVAAADRAAATSGGYRLLVKGGMITEKIKVAVAGSADWADYVFEPSYKLLPLDKVEAFINENKHLPNVPSAEEMSKNGLDVVNSDSKLLEKIEELTLYIIELNKEIQSLKIKK